MTIRTTSQVIALHGPQQRWVDSVDGGRTTGEVAGRAIAVRLGRWARVFVEIAKKRAQMIQGHHVRFF